MPLSNTSERTWDRLITTLTLVTAFGGLALHLAGWWRTTPGLAYTGTIINAGDASVYLAAMRQGAAGQWVFDIQFTPEAVAPRFQYLFYIVLGKVALWLPGTTLAWWHGTRVVSTAVALSTLWWSLRTLLPGTRSIRRLAWLIIVTAGGLGWLARLGGMPIAALPDLSMSEWTLFLTLLSPAHYGLGLALTLLIVTLSSPILEGSVSRRHLALVWGAAMALAIVYPYAVPLTAVILAAGWLLGAARRSNGWQSAVSLAFVASAWLPFAVYYGGVLRQDAYWWTTHIAGNSVPPPELTGLLLGLGLPGALAVAGIPLWLRQQRSLLVPAWLIVQVALLYLPVPYSGRFALALMVPIGVLAGNFLGQGSLFRSRRPVIALLLLLMTLSPLLVGARLLRNVNRSTGWAYYVPAGEVKAAQWLGGHSQPDDVILVYHQMGNLLPRYAPGRVFIGQSFLTADIEEKARLVAGFWHEAAPPGWRQTLLAEWQVRWIYAGSFEEALAIGEVRPPGTLVYNADGVRIYAVDGTAIAP